MPFAISENLCKFYNFSLSRQCFQENWNATGMWVYLCFLFAAQSRSTSTVPASVTSTLSTSSLLNRSSTVTDHGIFTSSRHCFNRFYIVLSHGRRLQDPQYLGPGAHEVYGEEQSGLEERRERRYGLDRATPQYFS